MRTHGRMTQGAGVCRLGIDALAANNSQDRVAPANFIFWDRRIIAIQNQEISQPV